MKIDLQTLDETARMEILALAEEAINYDGRFAYNKKQYVAAKAQDGSIEIRPFSLLKYKMDSLSSEKKAEFRNKVELAKKSSNLDDRKFQIEDILVEVREIESGKFTIHTFIVDPNTV